MNINNSVLYKNDSKENYVKLYEFIMIKYLKFKLFQVNVTQYY